MVKNSGQKNRTKRYAAEYGLTYQQAREALDAQHTQDVLAALVAECRAQTNVPGGRAVNLPFGANREGEMQWVFADPDDYDNWGRNGVYLDIPESHFSGTIEIVGGPGVGKTTLLNRMIAHRATEVQAPNSILLHAGDREFGAASARWKEWPQVVVIGPDGQVDGTAVNIRKEEDGLSRLGINENSALRVFDDWFTNKDGSLPRYTHQEIGSMPFDHPVRWRARVAASDSPAIAAVRPGHVSHLDESGEIPGVISGVGGEFTRGNPEVFSRGFVARDEFVFGQEEDSGPAEAWPADLVLVPDGEIPYLWEARLDGRRLGLPVEVLAGPGRVMYAETLTVFTEHSSPKKVSDHAEFIWLKRSDYCVDIDFPFTSGPRNMDTQHDQGSAFHAFPSLDVFPLMDLEAATSEEVEDAIEKALAAYWSIGERGTQEDEE